MPGTVLLIRLIPGTIGACLLLYAILRRLKAAAAKKQPVVQGQILSSELEQMHLKSHGTQYRAKVEYRYTVNDQQYNSRRVFIGDDMWMSQAGVAEKIIQRYLPGSEVNVHYNPESPEESLLEFTLSPLIIRAAIIGILLIVLAFLIPF